MSSYAPIATQPGSRSTTTRRPPRRCCSPWQQSCPWLVLGAWLFIGFVFLLVGGLWIRRAPTPTQPTAPPLVPVIHISSSPSVSASPTPSVVNTTTVVSWDSSVADDPTSEDTTLATAEDDDSSLGGADNTSDDDSVVVEDSVEETTTGDVLGPPTTTTLTSTTTSVGAPTTTTATTTVGTPTTTTTAIPATTTTESASAITTEQAPVTTTEQARATTTTSQPSQSPSVSTSASASSSSNPPLASASSTPSSSSSASSSSSPTSSQSPSPTSSTSATPSTSQTPSSSSTPTPSPTLSTSVSSSTSESASVSPSVSISTSGSASVTPSVTASSSASPSASSSFSSSVSPSQSPVYQLVSELLTEGTGITGFLFNNNTELQLTVHTQHLMPWGTFSFPDDCPPDELPTWVFLHQAGTGGAWWTVSIPLSACSFEILDRVDDVPGQVLTGTLMTANADAPPGNGDPPDEFIYQGFQLLVTEGDGQLPYNATQGSSAETGNRTNNATLLTVEVPPGWPLDSNISYLLQQFSVVPHARVVVQSGQAPVLVQQQTLLLRYVSAAEFPLILQSPFEVLTEAVRGFSDSQSGAPALDGEQNCQTYERAFNDSLEGRCFQWFESSVELASCDGDELEPGGHRYLAYSSHVTQGEPFRTQAQLAQAPVVNRSSAVGFDLRDHNFCQQQLGVIQATGSLFLATPENYPLLLADLQAIDNRTVVDSDVNLTLTTHLLSITEGADLGEVAMCFVVVGSLDPSGMAIDPRNLVVSGADLMVVWFGSDMYHPSSFSELVQSTDNSWVAGCATVVAGHMEPHTTRYETVRVDVLLTVLTRGAQARRLLASSQRGTQSSGSTEPLRVLLVNPGDRAPGLAQDPKDTSPPGPGDGSQGQPGNLVLTPLLAVLLIVLAAFFCLGCLFHRPLGHCCHRGAVALADYAGFELADSGDPHKTAVPREADFANTGAAMVVAEEPPDDTAVRIEHPLPLPPRSGPMVPLTMSLDWAHSSDEEGDPDFHDRLDRDQASLSAGLRSRIDTDESDHGQGLGLVPSAKASLTQSSWTPLTL